MAAIAAGVITEVKPGTSNGQMQIHLDVWMLDGSNLNVNLWTNDMSAGALAATVLSNCQQDAKDYLVSQHSVTFGLGDYVRIISAVI